MRNRSLLEYTARDVLGDQQPEYPKRQYQYFTSILGYNQKLLKHKFEIFTNLNVLFKIEDQIYHFPEYYKTVENTLFHQ